MKDFTTKTERALLDVVPVNIHYLELMERGWFFPMTEDYVVLMEY